MNENTMRIVTFWLIVVVAATLVPIAFGNWAQYRRNLYLAGELQQLRERLAVVEKETLRGTPQHSPQSPLSKSPKTQEP